MSPEPNEPKTPIEERDCGGEGERASPGSAIDDLLRNPSELARRGCGSEGRRLWLQLLLVALACFVAYGATAGLFRSGEQVLVAGAKTPLIVFGSLLLCLPSLYVFGSLAGVEWTGPRFATAVAGLVGMLGLLLAAMLPVQWLFSVSSRSLVFVVMLHVVLWSVALVQAYRFVRSAFGLGGISLLVWFLLLFLVSLQVTTQLRPVLTPGERFVEGGKKSFLEHWRELPAPVEGEEGR